MENNAMPFGFRILGNCSRERKLVDYDSAFAAYAECDDQAEIGLTAFLSPFQYDDKILTRLVDDGGKLDTTDFPGRCWSRFIWFDIDDAKSIDTAADSARRLCSTVLSRYDLDEAELLVFYSGRKGFHVGLPTSLFVPIPSATFHTATRCFAEGIASEAGVTIDTSIYSKVQPLRAPNSRHNKTGRYKRFVVTDELFRVQATAIRDRAKDPLPFEIPSPPAVDQRAVDDWNKALNQAKQKAELAVELSADRTALNRATVEFIRDGAAEGERHMRLFSAAANLAEFGCPDQLAHALLTESALDSGLTPSEVRRAITNGLKKYKTTKETSL